MNIYTIVEKRPNSRHLYDHGFLDNTNRQAVCKSQKFLLVIHKQQKNYVKNHWRLVLSMKPWSYNKLEFGLFSTIIAIIRASACWTPFVVTLTNTVHLFIYIYIYIYIRRPLKENQSNDWVLTHHYLHHHPYHYRHTRIHTDTFGNTQIYIYIYQFHDRSISYVASIHEVTITLL